MKTGPGDSDPIFAQGYNNKPKLALKSKFFLEKSDMVPVRERLSWEKDTSAGHHLWKLSIDNTVKGI